MLRSTGRSQITRRILKITGSFKFVFLFCVCDVYVCFSLHNKVKRQILYDIILSKKFQVQITSQNSKFLWKSLVQRSWPPSIAIRINTAAIGRLFHRPKVSHWSSLHLHPSSVADKGRIFSRKWLVGSRVWPLISTYIINIVAGIWVTLQLTKRLIFGR